MGGIWVELCVIPPKFHTEFHLAQTIDYQSDSYTKVEGWNYKRQKIFFLK